MRGDSKAGLREVTMLNSSVSSFYHAALSFFMAAKLFIIKFTPSLSCSGAATREFSAGFPEDKSCVRTIKAKVYVFRALVFVHTMFLPVHISCYHTVSATILTHRDSSPKNGISSFCSSPPPLCSCGVLQVSIQSNLSQNKDITLEMSSTQHSFLCLRAPRSCCV